MKILAYAVRGDEEEAFHHFSKELDLELTMLPQSLSLENAHFAKGFECVSILGNCNASATVLELLSQGGTRFLSSRSTGHDNIDIVAAKKNGIRFSNATYSPNSVADFTVMLMLMSIRKTKTSMARTAVQDFSLASKIGREMHNLTIGIVGTGRIGATTAQNLTGFGCELLGHDISPDENLKKILTYTSFDEILSKSDIITLHAPLTPENHHLINRDTLARTKHGIIIVNCARGELIDTEALIDAIEDGKVSAAALDVIERELGIFHMDHRLNLIKQRQLAILQSFPNVIVTGHSAFYTDQAVSDMVEVSLHSLVSFASTGKSQWEIEA